jgi:hypothetical protein
MTVALPPRKRESRTKAFSDRNDISLPSDARAAADGELSWRGKGSCPTFTNPAVRCDVERCIAS